ncbi:MAG: sulfite exporter TauE/SafE family protein [Bdellovibrionaceae bacterium]|nr:sulfite exporter TauE/SafE family protein [Pseudobdellovibrionaceae bacterium]
MLILFCALGIGGVVGLLGFGPALLSLPVLLYIKGDSFTSAVLMSLIIGMVFSSVAGWSRISDISIKKAAVFFPLAALGSSFGVHYSTSLIEFWRVILLSVVSFIAVGLIFYRLYKDKVGRRANTQQLSSKARVVNIFFFLCCSYIVGFLSAILGVSGGFLMTPLFIVAFSLPLSVAVATSLFLSVVNSIIALFFYYQSQPLNNFLKLDWYFLLQFLIIGILGVIVGVKFAKRCPSVVLKKLLAGSLFLLGLWNLYQVF